MSWLSWLVVLFASVLLIPGAFSIEVGFSAGNGGESAGLSSNYDVGTDVSVSEESSASTDQAKIENRRTVSGTGDINAVQTYSGSEGYAGVAGLTASGSGSLTSSAFLNPKYMTASQNIAASGSVDEAETSVNNRGSSAGVASSIKSGSLAADQRSIDRQRSCFQQCYF